MKYNIVIARTDAELFEFFFEEKKKEEEKQKKEQEEKQKQKANGEDSKDVEVEVEVKVKVEKKKVIPFDEIIILNEIEVKSVKIKSQESRKGYREGKLEKNDTNSKEDSEFGISIEGKIVPTLTAIENMFGVLGGTKGAVGAGLKYDNISKHDLQDLRDGFKINKNALENIPGMITKAEIGLSNAISLLTSTTELKSKVKNMWLTPLNNSVLNINNLKEWAECYEEYSKTKYPLHDLKAGEEVAEKEISEEKKKGNLQDYRDVLLLIKISDDHTLAYKFKELFIGDYQEEYSDAEGVG
ncbi:MAG: hypothetical protein ACRC0S_08345, partial [Fusobacteriaceae bacterium]